VSPFADPQLKGIGHASDPYKFVSGNNTAWRVGEFSIKGLESSGTNHLFLQIGYQGMRHVGDPTVTQNHPCRTENVCPAGTEVYFGIDSVLYNAHNDFVPNGSSQAHRQYTRMDDTYDLRINAVSSNPGDIDGNGTIGQEDYAAWYSTFGQPSGGGGFIDAADYVGWRKLTTGTGGSAGQFAIPEPHTISLAAILLLLLGPAQRLSRWRAT
jgi:hypothetical protein